MLYFDRSRGPVHHRSPLHAGRPPGAQRLCRPRRGPGDADGQSLGPWRHAHAQCRQPRPAQRRGEDRGARLLPDPGHRESRLERRADPRHRQQGDRRRGDEGRRSGRGRDPRGHAATGRQLPLRSRPHRIRRRTDLRDSRQRRWQGSFRTRPCTTRSAWPRPTTSTRPRSRPTASVSSSGCAWSACRSTSPPRSARRRRWFCTA